VKWQKCEERGKVKKRGRLRNSFRGRPWDENHTWLNACIELGRYRSRVGQWSVGAYNARCDDVRKRPGCCELLKRSSCSRRHASRQSSSWYRSVHHETVGRLATRWRTVPVGCRFLLLVRVACIYFLFLKKSNFDTLFHFYCVFLLLLRATGVAGPSCTTLNETSSHLFDFFPIYFCAMFSGIIAIILFYFLFRTPRWVAGVVWP